MGAKVKEVYYYDYSLKMGHYESIKGLELSEVEYVSSAISTQEIKVYVTPKKFKVDEKGSNKIKTFVETHIDELVETKEEVAVELPRYIMLVFDDDTKKYYQYTDEFCVIFSIAKCHKIKETDIQAEVENTYMIQKEDTFSYKTDYRKEKVDKCEKSYTTTNRRYCSKCGGPVDDETKKCTRCGKQFFNIKSLVKVIVLVAMSLALGTSVGYNVVMKEQIEELKLEANKTPDYIFTDEFYEYQAFWDENYEKVQFIDDNVVFVIDGYGDYYYTYDQMMQVTQGTNFTYWAYNVENAKYLGYVPWKQ